ncbi:hypothetical protein TIFTF001_041633 [Ficus carica]|uniref:Uncharacterized protein n=1 Tax=Ficus carica TaxID=3494 RepID=A0AA87ZZE6_FICCA|nr:hypothetical protein TIFTF001_041631 [Ficus carica]GMN31779.1 hypothetical protein TIFTF001_041633 [Ficus carica]
MQGVRTPSPMTIEVPSMVANNKKYLADLLYSQADNLKRLCPQPARLVSIPPWRIGI